MVGIAAKAGDVTATWDFKSMAAGTIRYEGNTGTVVSDVEGVELTVDATRYSHENLTFTYWGTGCFPTEF